MQERVQHEDQAMRRTLARLVRMRAPHVAAAVVVVIGLAGAVVLFVGGSSNTRSTPRPTSASSVRHVAQAAGPNPSESAQMVCAPEAEQDLGSALGAPTTAVTTPTWADHIYSCRYMYPHGSMALSVKELSSKAETNEYFKSLRAQLSESELLPGIAKEALVTNDG